VTNLLSLLASALLLMACAAPSQHDAQRFGTVTVAFLLNA
jgi:hypothetical protein